MSAALKIIADENIPQVRERFSALGEVALMPGREIRAADCRDADVLLVRSVTPVNQALLAGTAVKFVGSATIGVDHLDRTYLEQQGIAWANAPASNADSVVDYIFSAFCRLDGALQDLLSGASVGIVGMGNVGRRLWQCLDGLNVRCLGYDPLLDQSSIPILAGFEDVLSADFICLHAPLTRGGDYPTLHMFDEDVLDNLHPGATLINAGRGEVIDNRALLSVLQKRYDLSVVLDVWENEPNIDIELLKRVDLATPHIAGYSYDGKLAGTQMIYEACCEVFEQTPGGNSAPDDPLDIQLRPRANLADYIADAVLSVYDIAEDDQRMRGALLHRSDSIGETFDRLRKNYPMRRQFNSAGLRSSEPLSEATKSRLQALGFRFA